MKIIIFLLILVLSPVLQSCQAQQKENIENEPEYYSYQTASAGGIGKVYMGREIAQVMGHQGANWLERSERENEERPSLVIKNLDLPKNAVIADIGAGTGYYSFKLSSLVPEGQVIAVDIQAEMLEKIEAKKKKTRIQNISTVKGTEKSPNLPSDSLDAVLMVDVYHEFSYPREMMMEIYKALKKGGLLILLEFRAEDPNVPIRKLHKMSVEQILKEMGVVGLVLKENKKMLPRQHFLIFEKY